MNNRERPSIKKRPSNNKRQDFLQALDCPQYMQPSKKQTNPQTTIQNMTPSRQNNFNQPTYGKVLPNQQQADTEMMTLLNKEDTINEIET